MAGLPRALRWRRHPTVSVAESPNEDPNIAFRHGAGHRSLSARAAGMRARAEGTRDRLEAQRPTNPLVDAAFRWVQLQNETGGPLLAGAIAFRIFLFLLPCVFVVVLGLGIGADIADADPRDVARSFGMPGLVATAVQAGATSSAATRWVTFSLAVLALILGARNLLRALLVTHALLWRVPPEKVRHLTSASMAVIGTFYAGTLLLRLVYGSQSASIAVWVVGLVLFTGVPAGIWLVCSLMLFPHSRGVTWRDVLPGSLLFGVGVELLHLTTVLWFAPYLQAKSQTYGSIGAALAILIWAYLLGRLVTAAAAVNAVLWRRSSPRPGDHRES